MKTDNPAIRAEKINVGYGENTIIEDLSLEIPAGSFCSIIGPNGCGKSTLLRALSRNLRYNGGDVYIENRKLEKYDTKKLARKMAFLAQAPQIPDQFSVRDLVSYGRFPHTGWMGVLKQEDHDIIDNAMELTGISEFRDRELTHLSGGERQRVWISMALAQEAELLLLDEPTTYLDISHQLQTLELIKELHLKTGRTILMVLHDLNQAARYSDLIFVMNRGKLVSRGAPEDVITPKLLRNVFFIESKIVHDEEHNCPYFIPLRGISNTISSPPLDRFHEG